jgi:acetolactate synthase-1/2/3 large subunit
VGCPERQVVSLSGDGGFLFTGQELASAVQHGIGIVAIVFNDACYSAVKHMQRAQYDGRCVDVDLAPVDYCALARAYGAEAVRAAPERLGAALADALAQSSRGPVLIEVPVRFDRAW